MKTKLHSLFIGLALIASATVVRAQGTAFTYQGRLTDGTNLADGSYDLMFTLYDASSGGNPLGSPYTNLTTSVNNGLFTISRVDFGEAFFIGGPLRWIELGVRPDGSTNAFSPLDPRQQLTPTPYAIWSGRAGSATLAMLASAVEPLSVTGGGIANNTITAGKIASGQVVKTLNGLTDAVTLAAGSNVTITPSGNTLTVATSGLWKLAGNAATTPGTDFLGTTDNQALELKANSQRVLRLEPSATSPNVIGGYSGNFVGNGIVGATIGGGGVNSNTNAILAGFGTIAGGAGNKINAGVGTIGGGERNEIKSGSGWGTIGGGVENAIGGVVEFLIIVTGTNADFATIAGGHANIINLGADGATIGGGVANKITTNASYATIPGGRFNAATNYAFAAGHRAKANHTGAFVWADFTDADFASTTNDQVSFRCLGGVRFASGGGGANQTVSWAPGDAAWSFTSDRATKEGFRPVNGGVVLEKLARVPISEWNYIGYPQRHIGPTAQDFHALFPLNDSDTTLNTADLHGVALAAIQGLNQKLEQKETEIAELKQRLEKLEQLIKHNNGGAK